MRQDMVGQKKMKRMKREVLWEEGANLERGLQDFSRLRWLQDCCILGVTELIPV